jgi:hypothetical protein
MDRVCTDIDYAWSVAQYLKHYRPEAFTKIEHFVANLLGLRLSYERLDNLANPEFCRAAKGLDVIGSTLEHVWFGIAQANAVHKLLGLPARYGATNDNRWHQHHLLWPSTTRRTPTSAVTASQDEENVGFAEAQAEFEIVGQLRGDALSIPAAPAADAAFDIDLSKPIGGHGWYEPEHVGDSWYRWTGPEPRFDLEVLLSPGRSYFCDMVFAPVQARVFDGFSVTVNDVEIGYYPQELEDGAVHLRFAIPDAVAQSSADFCQIVFRHKSVYSPAEDGSGDARRLGFAVRSISLSPLPGEAATARVEDGGANDEVVLGPDFALADDASASHLPALDASIIQLQPELVGQVALVPLVEGHTGQARHRRGRSEVRGNRGRSA